MNYAGYLVKCVPLGTVIFDEETGQKETVTDDGVLIHKGTIYTGERIYKLIRELVPAVHPTSGADIIPPDDSRGGSG